MGAKGKKLHHFVPRFYLRAWANNGKVFCLQSGHIRSDSVRNLGSENYFYRLRELTSEDVDFLENFIAQSPEALRPSHETLLRALMLPHQLRHKIERLEHDAPEQLAAIDTLIVEFNENLHTGIEDDFQPYLKAMQEGSLDFLRSPKDSAIFYRALATQYARTNHIKQVRAIMKPNRLAMYERIANPLVHMMAVNVGFSLYKERADHTLRIITNNSDIPFVTGDQPVINLAAGPKDIAPPQRFELYYPVSPSRALVLLEPGGESGFEHATVSSTFVQLQNLRIAAHSYRQVYSNSESALELVRSELPAYMSCFRDP